MGWGEFWPAAADWAVTWIPVLGPLGILVTALVAYFGYRQKLEADRRAQWWVRAQWALEASLSANPRRSLAGLAVLNDLKTSSLATREDRELFRLIGVTAREELLGAVAGAVSGGAGPDGAPGATVSGGAAARSPGADGGGPVPARVRSGPRAGPRAGPDPGSGSVLEAALWAQVEKLAGAEPEPLTSLPGPPGAPTVGEPQNH
ncbi:MAG: hypothetical protein ABS909_04420 [Arthrobacter sp.]